MTGENGYRPINLLQQHDSHQLVRPSQLPERQPQLGPVAQPVGKAVRPANEEGGGGRPPSCQRRSRPANARWQDSPRADRAPPSPRLAAPRLASAFDSSVIRVAASRLRLSRIRPCRPGECPSGVPHRLRAWHSAPRGRAQVPASGGRLPRPIGASSCPESNAANSFRSLGAKGEFGDRARGIDSQLVAVSSPACWARRRPHPLQIVEGAHFRPEDVDDHVARIDQHPVAMRQPFHPRPRRYRASLRSLRIWSAMAPTWRFDLPRGHDHVVADRRLAVQVDGDCVLGLHVVQAGEDEAKRLLRLRTHLGDRFGLGSDFRPRKVQVWTGGPLPSAKTPIRLRGAP